MRIVSQNYLCFVAMKRLQYAFLSEDTLTFNGRKSSASVQLLQFQGPGVARTGSLSQCQYDPRLAWLAMLKSNQAAHKMKTMWVSAWTLSSQMFRLFSSLKIFLKLHSRMMPVARCVLQRPHAWGMSPITQTGSSLDRPEQAGWWLQGRTASVKKMWTYPLMYTLFIKSSSF